MFLLHKAPLSEAVLLPFWAGHNRGWRASVLLLVCRLAQVAGEGFLRTTELGEQVFFPWGD
jgi:hypothetical protein